MNQTFTSFLDFKKRYPIRPNDEGALLGSGSYGRVIKVEDQLETEWVAIKISEFKGNDSKSLQAEVELAKRVPRQANIARYDACHRLETDTSVSDFAIMKYYPDGNLADLIRRITLTPVQIYEITQGILLGLQHLHRHRIVHRDFKPANILISRDNAGRFIPKIADFGLSRLVREDELDSSDFDLSDGRGTPSYKAPEQIEGSRVSFNLDLWAFGVILYEMMTGEKPFRADLRNSSEQSARREIEKKIITVELPTRINQIAEPYSAMIRRCLVRDIHERVRKEDELLDLLDLIPHLLTEAKSFLNNRQYEEAIASFEQILAKRENHAEAQKGIDQCTAALHHQLLANLLTEADGLLSQQLFEQAKSRYEQVLQLNPIHEMAIRGLALCIEQLRPKPLVVEPELTDVYQEERTDVYVAPPAPISVEKAIPKPASIPKSTPIAPVKRAASPSVQRETGVKPTVLQPAAHSFRRAFPWRIVAPVVVGLGGIMVYINLRGTKPTETTSNQKQDSTLTAGVGPSSNGKTIPRKDLETVKLKLVPGESKAALDKRIDIALKKARQAYRVKDFYLAITLTRSALQLDPTRRDIAELQTEALKEIQKKTPENGKLGDAVMPNSDPPKAVVPEPEKPKASEPAPVEKTANVKEEAQEQYDQLIEDGLKAIAKGNNKTKAIDYFTSARSLAKEHDLITAKADAAYTSYMATANRIFDRDEFDGAKGWYQVAQSLKDTDEVKRKIKQSTNQ
ncbi:serine/threonine-protein kinase [Spirosoma flavum]|uniref:Protein kinase n=1 Tax=Spirosoma flavum TaxID=2048557 RepID=A0ABW6AR68_9BACT